MAGEVKILDPFSSPRFFGRALCLLAGVNAMIKTSVRRKRQSRREQATHDEPDKDVCEFYTAAVEAMPYGARVPLGDRDFKVCVFVPP